MPTFLPQADQKLVQIIDVALADAARRSGEWLVCHPGCTQCCVGVFAINQLDAARLRRGLETLAHGDHERAEQVRKRALASVARLSPDFPGDLPSGILDEGEEADKRFEELGNQEPCPALDPVTGMCDLYSTRPMMCRTFGPPVRSEGGLGVCELCYHGATDDQIAACEMIVANEEEAEVLAQVEANGTPAGRTIVAFALVR